MERQTNSELAGYELTLIEIVRKLPSDRVAQLVDFAHFLEIQTDNVVVDNGQLEKNNLGDNAECASPDKWDQLLARPDAKSMMRTMAREALEEHRAGRTTDIATTENGRLSPA